MRGRKKAKSVTVQNALLIAKEKALSGLLGLSSSPCSISKVPFAQASGVTVFCAEWQVGFHDLFWRGSLKESFQRHDTDL